MIATDSLGAPPALGLRREACAALARAGTLLRAASTGASTDVLPEVIGEARLARAAWRLARSTDGACLVGDADRALAELHGRLPAGSSADRVVAAREATRSAGLPAPSEALEAWLAVAGTVRRRAAVRPDPAPFEELVRHADAARELLVAAPWAPDEGSAVAASLARATDEVRGAMARARHGAFWRLHACRGPLDELRHALRALGRAAASAGRRDAFGAPARDVEGLAALAGRDHDQALLRATLSRVDLPAALAPEASRLRAASDADRERTESLARPLLARLFGEPGGALGRAVFLSVVFGVREGGAGAATPSGSGLRRPAGSAR